MLVLVLLLLGDGCWRRLLGLWLRVRLLRNSVQDLVLHAEVADGVPADVAVGDLPELVGVPGGAYDVLEVHVHVRVAVKKNPVVSLTVLELDENGVSLCAGK